MNYQQSASAEARDRTPERFPLLKAPWQQNKPPAILLKLWQATKVKKRGLKSICISSFYSNFGLRSRKMIMPIPVMRISVGTSLIQCIVVTSFPFPTTLMVYPQGAIWEAKLRTVLALMS